MDSNTLTIKTENTKNAFFESDEYSFAYKEQPFLHAGDIQGLDY